MTSRLRVSTSFIAAILCAGASLACEGSSPPTVTLPTPSLAPFTLTSITPETGSTDGGTVVTISGEGFQPGAGVAIGGILATDIVVAPNSLTVTTRPHVPGAVDVIVTNPGGAVRTLLRAYSYEIPAGGAPPYILTVSTTTVAPGGDVTVSWKAPSGQSVLDWISVFAVGAPNTSYGPYEYTAGATSGTLTFHAPTQPGEYEFRYLLNDGYVDVARSSVVTVTGSGS